MTSLVLLLALTSGPSATSCTPQFAPLYTGSHSALSELPLWRKDAAGAWDGEGWLGWTWRGEVLQSVRLIVRDLPKQGAGDVDEVTVQSFPDVDFAVRCVPALRAGTIATADVVNQSLTSNQPLAISLGSRRYEVVVRSMREDLFDARVILKHGDVEQVLYSVNGFADEPHFEIEWAGDLDRDGRLDLVVNLHYKYSWHPHRLLLSSAASDTQLIGDVAVFETGC